MEYPSKFVELAKFYPHYNVTTIEFSKCIKFENGWHQEIKQAIGYQQIHVFSELVGSCRTYKDNKAHSSHYKSLKEKTGRQYQDRKKPYDSPADKGKQKAYDGKKTNGGGAPASIKWYRCGEQGH